MDGVAARRRQEEQRLLEVRCEQQQVHDLRDPRARDVAQVRDVGHRLDRAVVDLIRWNLYASVRRRETRGIGAGACSPGLGEDDAALSPARVEAEGR